MGITYTKAETISRTKAAMENPDSLYRDECINWGGITSGQPSVPYSQVIAEVLLDSNIANVLQQIPIIHRENYRVDTHNGFTPTPTNRQEEVLAKALFTMCSAGCTLSDLGTIFDYQVPLKSISQDNAGKIDLVAVNHKDNKIWLVELKRQDSTETLLRCMLEIATYYQVLDKDSFINSYKGILDGMKTESISKAVLVYKDSYLGKEIVEMRKGNRPHLQQLAQLLETSFFLLNCEKV